MVLLAIINATGVFEPRRIPITFQYSAYKILLHKARLYIKVEYVRNFMPFLKKSFKLSLIKTNHNFIIHKQSIGGNMFNARNIIIP